MKRAWILPLLLLLVLVNGCKAAPAGSDAVVVVLIDMTTSARDDANTYMRDFTAVLNAAQGGEKIVVVPVTGSFVPEIRASLLMPKSTHNPVSDAKKLKEARIKLQGEVAALLKAERPKEPGTAILSAIAKAAAVFQAEGEGKPRTLVILSDMIEQGKLDFTSASLTPPGPVIDRLQKEGLVPRLDADVFVAGITAGQANTFQVPQERFQAITQFWAAYFERAGARLGPYDRDLLGFKFNR